MINSKTFLTKKTPVCRHSIVRIFQISKIKTFLKQKCEHQVILIISSTMSEKVFQDRLEELTRENQRLRALIPASEEVPIISSPSADLNSYEASFLTPTIIKKKPKGSIDNYNRCAKAILDHQREKAIWRANNYADDSVVSALMYDANHYMTYASISSAKYKNGAMVQGLLKMRSA